MKPSTWRLQRLGRLAFFSAISRERYFPDGAGNCETESTFGFEKSQVTFMFPGPRLRSAFGRVAAWANEMGWEAVGRTVGGRWRERREEHVVSAAPICRRPRGHCIHIQRVFLYLDLSTLLAEGMGGKLPSLKNT